MPTFSWMFVIIILSSTEGMYKNKQIHFCLFKFNLYSYLSKKKKSKNKNKNKNTGIDYLSIFFPIGIFLKCSR